MSLFDSAPLASLDDSKRPLAERMRPDNLEGFVGQQQEAAVVDDQGQSAAALLLGPADPLVARAQTARGGAKNQHTQPVATSVSDGVEELLADGADIAQIMMSGQQATSAPFGFGCGEQLDLNLSQRD